MLKRLSSLTTALALLLALGAVPVFAGGYTVVSDITGRTPASIPGTVYGKLVPTRWDARCIPVKFRMNRTLNPIPNPLGAPFLSMQEAKTAIKRAFATWNAVPTAYIDFQFTAGNLNNPGLRRFDFINEVTFRSGAGLTGAATTVATRLGEDGTLVDGNDFDGDGDSDVSNDITQCRDVDGDGDIEFPEGFYRAGTILDLDLVFNTKATNGSRFTTTTDIEELRGLIHPASIDLQAEATRQVGIAMGLTGAFTPEINPQNKAIEPTMYGFINTADSVHMISRRKLAPDDRATLSFLYPEGSDASGPAALQGHDVAFGDVYGIIEGTVRHGRANVPVLAGNITAVNKQTGDQLNSAYIGNGRLAVNPNTGVASILPPSEGIVDGRYQLPVPFGTYELKLEAVDGFPQAAGAVNTNTVLGEAYGLNNFLEERWSGVNEGARERNPGESKTVQVTPSQPIESANFVTNRTVTVTNAGGPNRGPFTDPPGVCFAVHFPISQLISANPFRNLQLTTALVEGVCPDETIPNIFAGGWLAYGKVNGSTATIDLAHPLEAIGSFAIQQFDREPWYFRKTNLAQTIFKDFDEGRQTDVFLVYKTPDEIPANSFSGLSTRPAVDLRSDGFVPVGLSYLAADCVHFEEDPDRLFQMDLIYSE